MLKVSTKKQFKNKQNIFFKTYLVNFYGLQEDTAPHISKEKENFEEALISNVSIPIKGEKCHKMM